VYIGFIPIMFCHTIQAVYRDKKVCFDGVDLIGSTRKEINQGDSQHENLSPCFYQGPCSWSNNPLWPLGNLQAPLDNLANLVDATGVSHDFYVIGLQETPTFDVESAIADALGANYW